MKKFLLVLVVLLGSVLLYSYAKQESLTIPLAKKDPVKTVVPKVVPQTELKHYLFVPYWTFTKTIVADSEDSLIYFGVGVNAQGLETGDRGYLAIPTFIKLTPNARERILAVRMLDKTLNAKVLKDPLLQEKIASQAVDLAQKNKFDGVLLDYETSAFGFDSVTNNITSFYRLFSEKVHASGLLFYATLYGDAYFQSRPFDAKQIGLLADKVLIMAYDFSKSRGNPGPNFPLTDLNSYGYDFEKMVDDFQKDVDNQKLVVTLGYFGYDWKVDAKGESVTNGVPLSTNEIEKEFVNNCKYKNCSLLRNSKTSEPSIRYVDGEGSSHVVWFEDAISVDKKKEFLKSKGILETSSWAYSYY